MVQAARGVDLEHRSAVVEGALRRNYPLLGCGAHPTRDGRQICPPGPKPVEHGTALPARRRVAAASPRAGAVTATSQRSESAAQRSSRSTTMPSRKGDAAPEDAVDHDPALHADAFPGDACRTDWRKV